MSSSASTRVLHRNLPMLLLRAREKMMERFRPLITAHGLTEQQWRAIRALNEHGPMEPRHISDICTISSPSMAGVLARMESMELITKERFAEDQRRVLVRQRRDKARQQIAVRAMPDSDSAANAADGCRPSLRRRGKR